MLSKMQKPTDNANLRAIMELPMRYSFTVIIYIRSYVRVCFYVSMYVCVILCMYTFMHMQKQKLVTDYLDLSKVLESMYVDSLVNKEIKCNSNRVCNCKQMSAFKNSSLLLCYKLVYQAFSVLNTLSVSYIKSLMACLPNVPRAERMLVHRQKNQIPKGH